jgi:nucleoside phosphorylase
MRKVIDILIYIALNEEFENVLQGFGIDFQAQELKTTAITTYDGTITERSGRSLLVRLVNAGRMGNVASGVNMSSLIDEFKPLNVIVLGIAGAISDDLKLGDIFIPSRVDEYLANSAAVGNIYNEFIPSGNFYEADRRLLDRFRNFASVYKESYNSWRLNYTSILKREITQEKLNNLHSLDIDLSNPDLIVGDDRSLASGHSVVKGHAFTDWLKKKFDRKISAVEMESAGIFEAVNSKIIKPRVLAIRPISDYADDRKEKIENTAGKTIRTLCMQNAVTLIHKAIFEGVFQPEKKSPYSIRKVQ